MTKFLSIWFRHSVFLLSQPSLPIVTLGKSLRIWTWIGSQPEIQTKSITLLPTKWSGCSALNPTSLHCTLYNHIQPTTPPLYGAYAWLVQKNVFLSMLTHKSWFSSLSTHVSIFYVSKLFHNQIPHFFLPHDPTWTFLSAMWIHSPTYNTHSLHASYVLFELCPFQLDPPTLHGN